MTCIYQYPDAFYTEKRSLKEACPAADVHAKTNGQVSIDEDDEATLIGQSDIPPQPVIDHEDKSLFKTVVLGIPDWNEIDFSYFTIGINIVLSLLALDLVFRGPLLHPSADIRFSRVGYVDSTSAQLLIREPDPAQFPIYVHIKDHRSGNWRTGDTKFYAGEDTDYTFPTTLSSLSPDSEYTYDLSNKLTGTFRTTPSQTDPANGKLTFLTSSCIKANFPYSPFNHALGIPGFKHLSTIIQSLPSPAAFMLFLGDFIYIDVPLRLSSTISHYRSEYRRVYASPSWRLPGISAVPWLHTLDDHEIANDWSGGNETEPFPSAADPFIHYHVSVNPPIPPSSPKSNTTYFQFTRGPASFFMLDTRRYRTAPEPPSQQPLPAPQTMSLSTWFRNTTTTPPIPSAHTMLGTPQLSCLLTFLSNPEPSHIHWKIITSSVPFTQNWRFGTADTWGGYLSERRLILNAMHAAEARLGVRVIVLSGDRHEFGAVRFPPPVENAGEESERAYDPTPQAGPHEFSVGPLSMFYLPFRTFRAVDGQDVTIKYWPDGNSKIGVVELQNLAGENSALLFLFRADNTMLGVGAQKSLLKYSLYVDGRIAWEYTLTSPGVGFEGHRGRVGWGWF